MTGWVKKHQIAVGIWLPLCPSCAEVLRTLRCPREIVNINVDVSLLGQPAIRPSRRLVIFDVVRVQDQFAELHDDDTFGCVADYAAQECGPELA